MESFISEIENPIVQKDIIELGQKIQAFKEGQINDDKFRALRLARGVYGQRQQGVQMIRIKLPFGKVTSNQLRRISAVSDEYSTGKLHITTRQDIQIHYVRLDRTPQLWAELEKDDVTLREACGNTVRNVTASSIAGIDPNEPFDVSPYADLVFRYFLRKPFGQELGRKIKIAFSSNDKDDAYTFIHDFGFIPKINENGSKGFKVLVGGGLGAQPFLAKVAYDFLPATELIPFIEASIRVFDRHGERNSRHKARIKYLVDKLGIDGFLELVNEEKKAIQYTDLDFNLNDFSINVKNVSKFDLSGLITDATDIKFKHWLTTNVFEQKQEGYFGVFIKVLIGDFSSDQARKLANLIDYFQIPDVRFTIDQSILLKYVKGEQLEELYKALQVLNFAHSGYGRTSDVTACPGTDTCNLGISDSINVAKVIEQFINDSYPEFSFSEDIKIKISGCMNSCGQHGLAQIGFHGSSQKVNGRVLPSLQLLLGGGVVGNGKGRISEKVIKIPSKRVLSVIQYLLDNYLELKFENELFNEYYDRQGNKYFYDLLKPLTSTDDLKDEDFIDWGHEAYFKTEIGIGECAGVLIDLVGTLLFDAEEKKELASEALKENRFADSIYFTYAAGVYIAKALLIDRGVRCNTQQGIIDDFTSKQEEFFPGLLDQPFSTLVLQIKENEPSKDFAESYFKAIDNFFQKAIQFRNNLILEKNEK